MTFVFAVVTIVYLVGGLEFLERRWMDARFNWVTRPADGKVTVVAIDSNSMRQLDVWPWPRGYHATVLERLEAAGASRVAFDIDFSSRSEEPEEDIELSLALERSAVRVVLPVFVQWERHSEQGARLGLTEPLPDFARHATLGAINIQPEPDGLIRRYGMRTPASGVSTPSFAAALAREPLPEVDRFSIDFGIDPYSIQQISYVDVLTGEFDPRLVEGRVVIVGATAVELGDLAAVPNVSAIPGPLLQALAFQSITQGRALSRSGPVTVLILTLVLAVFVGPWILCASWRGGLVRTAISIASVLLVSVVVQIALPVQLDAAPQVLTIAGVYALSLVRRIDQQALVVLVQSRQIRQTETLMRHVVFNSFDAIVTLGADGRVETLNPAAERIFGRSADEAVGTDVTRLVLLAEDTGDRDTAFHALTGHDGLREAIGRCRDGREFPVELAVTHTACDGRERWILFARDITERKAHQKTLEHQAAHDPLTNLPNRYLLRRRVQELLADARASGRPVAFLLLDLDRFKEINDTLGHHTGDLLLQQIARNLAGALRHDDTIARLGGDEFAVLLPDTEVESALIVAQRLADSLDQPFRIEGLSLQVDTSIGVALFPDHGSDAVRLIQRADVAMYVAKRSGAGIGVYDPETDFTSVRQLSLTGELRGAIETEQLELHYQPKVSTRDGTVLGVEALVRWRHPTHGNIPPDEFIGLAEQGGLIHPLTVWVVEKALGQCVDWERRGLRLDVSVNISAKNLLDTKLPENLHRMLGDRGLPAERLTLEITESMIMEDPERALEVIIELAALGVRISIDDFGTGYSSLGYLKQLPASELKIDKSFVMEMDRNHDDAMIVHSTIDLAHNLGLEVVAEGVETEAVWGELKRLGCDVAQGYLFSRPLAPEEFETWSQERARREAEALVS